MTQDATDPGASEPESTIAIATARAPSPRGASTVSLWLGLTSIVVIWCAYAITRLHGFVLGVGSIHEPTHDSLALALVLSAAGIPATYLATRLGLRSLHASRLAALKQALTGSDRRTTLWAIGLFGALAPALVRYAVLSDAPLTDDEGSYRFAAELLASGRLSAPSPGMPVFFDNGFLINDGKLYSQYFLGWPALLSLGVLLRLPGLVNPILSGLTAVVIALIAERRFGESWARVSALLFVASPFIVVSAATEMSHTSSTFALASLLFAVDRSAEPAARWRESALIALSFCVAFWIRPATALGFGLPLLLSWLCSLFRSKQRGVSAVSQLATFLGVSGVAGLLFLWVNQQQTGSPFQTGYHAAYAHAAATHYRFVSFGPKSIDASRFLYFFVQLEPLKILAKYLTAAMRLWTDAFGFPLGLCLTLFATRAGSRRLLAPMLGLALAHVPLPDAGIDSFGPVHYTELMIPLVLLSTDGLRTLHALGARIQLPALAAALLLACFSCAAVFYAVPRFTTLALLAADIRGPLDAFASAPEGSVVFTRFPFAPSCLARPGAHWVLFRPNNDPDLKNARLWANHIDLETDRKLLAASGRQGFLMRQDRTRCTWDLVPLELASAAEYPPTVKLVAGDLGEAPRAK